MYTNPEIASLKRRAFTLLAKVDPNAKSLNQRLKAALASGDSIDSEIEKFLVGLDYEKIKAIPEFVEARNILSQIMEIVATEIASNWNDPRYSRELAEE